MRGSRAKKERETGNKERNSGKVKIGIVTIHWGVNYGSVLQTYALSHKIMEIRPQSNVKVINYLPKVDSIRRRYFYTKRYSWPKNILYLAVTMPVKMKNQFVFTEFLKHNVPLSAPLYSEEEVRDMFSDLDICITGSDQVWNSDYNEGFDPVYYLSFVSETTKRLSYAASIGRDDFSMEEQSKVKEALEKFNGISVREISAQKIINRYAKCEVVLDPVFLLSHEEWEKLFKHVRHLPDHYVLLFCIGAISNEIKSFTKKLSKEKGIEIVELQFGNVWTKDRIRKTILNKSPGQFLWLVDKADFVVTNSYHGTAFSIHFKKQFYVFKRTYNSRIESLLSVFNLQKRMIENGEVDLECIDYTKVEEVKKEWITKSEKFLYSNI